MCLGRFRHSFLTVCDFYCFQITLITFGWVGAVKKLFTPTPLRSVPVADDQAHRVQPEFKGNLASTPRKGIATLYDLAKDSFSRYSDRNCMAVREFKGWYKPKVKQFGDVSWHTFEQVGDASHKFGAALRARGLVAAPDVTTLDKIKTPCSIAIFENTSAEWMIAAIGAFSQAMIVTTVYATLGMDAVIEAINDGSISAVVCNKTNVQNLVDKIGTMKSLKTIIYTNDSVDPNANIDLPKPPRGVVIVSFDDFVASGVTTAFPPTPPKSGTCAVIMYTSGSTGKVSCSCVIMFCQLVVRVVYHFSFLAFCFSPREL